MKTRLLMALSALVLGFGVLGGPAAQAADEPDGANNQAGTEEPDGDNNQSGTDEADGQNNDGSN